MTDREKPRLSVVPGGLDPAGGKVVAIPRATARPRALRPAADADVPSDREMVAGLVRRRDELHAQAVRLADRAHAALDAVAALQASIDAFGGED